MSDYIYETLEDATSAAVKEANIYLETTFIYFDTKIKRYRMEYYDPDIQKMDNMVLVAKVEMQPKVIYTAACRMFIPNTY